MRRLNYGLVGELNTVSVHEKCLKILGNDLYSIPHSEIYAVIYRHQSENLTSTSAFCYTLATMHTGFMLSSLPIVYLFTISLVHPQPSVACTKKLLSSIFFSRSCLEYTFAHNICPGKHEAGKDPLSILCCLAESGAYCYF